MPPGEKGMKENLAPGADHFVASSVQGHSLFIAGRLIWAVKQGLFDRLNLSIIVLLFCMWEQRLLP